MGNGITILAALGLSLLGGSVAAHADEGPFQLRTQFTGKGKCLDIVNDGRNNQLIMAPCGNYSGQMWTVSPRGTPGRPRLRTPFTGKAKCLDTANDGDRDRRHP